MSKPELRRLCITAGLLALSLLALLVARPIEGAASPEAYLRALWPPLELPAVTEWRSTRPLRHTEAGGLWWMTNGDLQAAIDPGTGALCSLESREPTVLDVLPPTQHGFLVYIWDREHDRFAGADRMRSREFEVKDGVPEARFELDFEEGWASDLVGPVAVRYRMQPDRLEIRAELHHRRDANGPFEIGTLQPYRAGDWDRQLAYDNDVPNSQSRRFQYYDAPWQVENTEGKFSETLYTMRCPYLVLGRPDRFLLYGYLDLNSVVSIWPNHFGCQPAFTIFPAYISAGQEYTFDYFIKTFPRPDRSLTDVTRWYFQHTYSTNPLTRGLVTLPENPKPRHLDPGNVTCPYAPWRLDFPNGDRFLKMLEDAQDRLHLIHLWWSDGRVHERWPEAGTPDAERVLGEVRRLQAKGYKVYFYFRNYWGEDDVYDDRPPYRDWLLVSRGQLVHGDPVKFWGDACNPDFIKWYVADVKRAVDYFQPDGIAWDQGWADVTVGLCDRHPGSGLHHGWLRIQAEVYQWLREKYPEKRVIQNTNVLTPSELYCDAVMFEGGPYDSVLSDISGVRAFGITVVHLDYMEFFRGVQDNIEWLLRFLAHGAIPGTRGFDMFDFPDAATWFNASLMGKSKHLLALADYLDFSAEAASLSRVDDSQALRISAAGAVGTLWVGPNRLLAAVFNDTDRPADLTLRIDRKALARWGYSGELTQPQLTVLGSDALPHADLPAHTAGPTGDELLIEARLGGKELLLVQ